MKTLVSRSTSFIVSKVAEVFDLIYRPIGITQTNKMKDTFLLFCSFYRAFFLSEILNKM